MIPIRRFVARHLALVALLLLAACSVRPGPGVLSPHPEAATDAASVVRIYAATNRALAGDFTGLPAFTTAYRYYDISVPPGAQGIAIPYPGNDPDPATDFLVLDSGVLDRAAFLAATRKAAGQEDLGLYVHGYNTRFQEALFRVAQISAGGVAAAPVLFSWPSMGKPLDYEADRQAALYSRDPLARLITDLSARDRRLVLFGHSMGGFLTVEALRTLKLSGRQDVLDRSTVVLAAPDIDVFVFAEQMKTIGPMKTPMVILTASDDRALALSSRLAGGRPRVGALPASSPMVAEAARRGNVQIIDISAVEADPLRHQRYITLAQLYTREARALPELHVPGAYVFDALSRSLIAP